MTDFTITGYSEDEMDKLLRNTSIMADTFLAGMNTGIDTTPAAPAPTAAPAATFSSGDAVTQDAVRADSAPAADPFSPDSSNVSRETASDSQATVATDSPAPVLQQDMPPAPPVDDTVYFTISYTVTGPQRDVIQAGIRRAQAATSAATSAVALVALAEAYK